MNWPLEESIKNHRRRSCTALYHQTWHCCRWRYFFICVAPLCRGKMQVLEHYWQVCLHKQTSLPWPPIVSMARFLLRSFISFWKPLPSATENSHPVPNLSHNYFGHFTAHTDRQTCQANLWPALSSGKRNKAKVKKNLIDFLKWIHNIQKWMTGWFCAISYFCINTNVILWDRRLVICQMPYSFLMVTIQVKQLSCNVYRSFPLKLPLTVSCNTGCHIFLCSKTLDKPSIIFCLSLLQMVLQLFRSAKMKETQGNGMIGTLKRLSALQFVCVCVWVCICE